MTRIVLIQIQIIKFHFLKAFSWISLANNLFYTQLAFLNNAHMFANICFIVALKENSGLILVSPEPFSFLLYMGTP